MHRRPARVACRARADLLAAALAAGGYAALIGGGQRARVEIEDALREALGDDYAQRLARAPEAADLATPVALADQPFPDGRRQRRRRPGSCPTHEGGKRFELDVFQHRDKPTGAPVLLQIHGGGWMIGEKEQQGIPLMMRMAARSWVGVSMNYPLSPRARWPEHLVAVKRAIAWIRDARRTSTAPIRRSSP